MEFVYNGVKMELVQIDRAERVPVYTADGMDLLYIKWIISATCLYTPWGYPVGTSVQRIRLATQEDINPNFKFSADLHGVNPPNIGPMPQRANNPEALRDPYNGYTAAVTDVELKSRLLSPRASLQIYTWDAKGNRTMWLQSPKPGLRCDVTGGPKPLSVDVVSMAGEGLTFGVHFQIMTCTSPCPDGSDRLILGHRWEMDHVQGKDQYLHRVIQGEVVFHQGLLETNAFNPDWVRQQFFHPIPLGMQREGIQVSRSSDGATIAYRCEDVDTSVTFDAGDSGATEMDIIENLRYEQPWTPENVGGVIGGVWRGFSRGLLG